MRRVVACFFVVLTCWGAVPARAEAPGVERLYLLAAAEGNTYWSADPFEPEASAASLTGCGAEFAGTPTVSPCLRSRDDSGATANTFWALPMTLLEEPITWGPEAPLRFRFAVSTTSLTPVEVRLAIQVDLVTVESASAVEVSPGVYEGVLATTGQIPPSKVAFIGARVVTADTYARVTLRTRGASWVDLLGPVRARSVGALAAADAYRPAPTTLTLGTRTLSLNDDDFSVHTATGRTDTEGRIELPLTRAAASIVAWVEAFEAPILHDPVARGTLEPTKVGRAPGLVLSRGTNELERSSASQTVGIVGIAALSLSAETHALRITPSTSAEYARPWRAYVVVLYGERTLERMRWSFGQYIGARTPVASVCPSSNELFPVTAAVASYRITVAADEVTPLPHAWVPRFFLPGIGAFPCAELGDAPSVRLVGIGPHVAVAGATPARRNVFVSAADVVFEMDVSFIHRAP